MKILSAFGVIEIRRGNGTYVASSSGGMALDPLLFSLLVSSREIGELAELRCLIEEGIIALIVERAGEADFGAIESICAEMAAGEARPDSGFEPRDSAAFLDLDLRYHLELGHLTGNRLVENVYAFVIDLLAPTMRPGFGTETHRKLARALRDGDLALALDMVREHDDVWRGLNSGSLGTGAKAER